MNELRNLLSEFQLLNSKTIVKLFFSKSRILRKLTNNAWDDTQRLRVCKKLTVRPEGTFQENLST